MIRTTESRILAALGGSGPSRTGRRRNPRLKPHAVVNAEVVRIGDLIETRVRRQVPVFRAPDLGQTGAVPDRASPRRCDPTA